MKKSLVVLVALAVAAGSSYDAHAGCGDYNGDGSVGASDALGVLQTAIHSRSCDKVRCDVDGNGSVTGTDALIVLKNALGLSIAWKCPGVAIGSIDQLPRATGPVAGGLSLNSLVSGAGLTAGGAETGISLGTLGPDTFDGDSSMAACEVSNMTRNALNDAAKGDTILCYVQNVFGVLESPNFDIYDGQYHTFALNFGNPPPGAKPEDHGGPARVRLRLVRDGDTITDFELFACSAGAEGLFQSEYVRQTIDGPDFTMSSKGREGGNHDEQQVTVRGTLNDAGQFVGHKDVETAHSFDSDEGANEGVLDFVQGADVFSLDGYDSGSFANEGGSGTFARQIHAEAELLDFNVPEDPYRMSLLAIGHGAARARSAGADNFGQWVFEDTQGWNGDTTLVDADAAAEFLTSVLGVELAPVGGAVDVVFGEGEAWDCSGEPEALLTINETALDRACSDLRLGWNWVNCWEIIQPPPPPPPCEGPDCAPPPCEGSDCPPPCDGPDCGPPPCEGADCPPPCEGPQCNVECWDQTCTCDPQAPGCFDACWICEPPPCEGPGCPPPCEGPDCP